MSFLFDILLFSDIIQFLNISRRTKMDIFVRDHNNHTLQPISIQVMEAHYSAKFVGDFCVQLKGGGWSDFPIAIFYQPTPKFELGHSHYFGLFVDETGNLLITNGDSAFDDPITGVVADNGEVIFSRYRHDFTTSSDGSVWIDGGRDYCRSNTSTNIFVKLKVDKDKIVTDTFDN
jgi:hypothetical protein